MFLSSKTFEWLNLILIKRASQYIQIFLSPLVHWQKKILIFNIDKFKRIFLMYLYIADYIIFMNFLFYMWDNSTRLELHIKNLEQIILIRKVIIHMHTYK